MGGIGYPFFSFNQDNHELKGDINIDITRDDYQPISINIRFDKEPSSLFLQGKGLHDQLISFFSKLERVQSNEAILYRGNSFIFTIELKHDYSIEQYLKKSIKIKVDNNQVNLFNERIKTITKKQVIEKKNKEHEFFLIIYKVYDEKMNLLYSYDETDFYQYNKVMTDLFSSVEKGFKSVKVN